MMRAFTFKVKKELWRGNNFPEIEQRVQSYIRTTIRTRITRIWTMDRRARDQRSVIADRSRAGSNMPGVQNFLERYGTASARPPETRYQAKDFLVNIS